MAEDDRGAADSEFLTVGSSNQGLNVLLFGNHVRMLLCELIQARVPLRYQELGTNNKKGELILNHQFALKRETDWMCSRLPSLLLKRTRREWRVG